MRGWYRALSSSSSRFSSWGSTLDISAKCYEPSSRINIPSSPNFKPALAASWNGIFPYSRRVPKRTSSIGSVRRMTS